VVVLPPVPPLLPGVVPAVRKGVTLTNEKVARQTKDTAVTTPPARTLATAAVTKVVSGRPFQLQLKGLPSRSKVQAFIVVGGKRIPLAALTTTASGGLTLPALKLATTGTHHVGITLPNGTVRWIKVQVG